MARIDLHNFFKFYDEKNPNHVKAVQWLEDNLPVKYLEDNIDWAEIYRGKKTSAAPASAPAAAAPVTSGDDVPQMGIKLRSFSVPFTKSSIDVILKDRNGFGFSKSTNSYSSF